MNTAPTQDGGRFLIVGDLGRLGPIFAEAFKPNRIEGVHGYLEGIAEIPRSETRGVLVGFDPACRNPQAAIAAIKDVAGSAPVILCCEPAYEQNARQLLSHGADDYVIFPPEKAELESAFGLSMQQEERMVSPTAPIAPGASADELAKLAEVLPALTLGGGGELEAMAELICLALNADGAIVTLDERSGQCGQCDSLSEAATLIEPIDIGDRRMGVIQVGRSKRDGFSREDAHKLRLYSKLFARMIESTAKASEWQRLAESDELTGLPNRRRLMEYLANTLAQAEKARATVTTLVFDIDDFKRYNDQYGHSAGDEILCEVSRLFLQCCRKTDMVARYGGDEFVVVFWDPEGPRTAGSKHPEGVISVVERFRNALKEHRFERLGREAQGCLTISGGLAHYPWQARTGVELIQAADHALLRAKEAGKNRFWVVGGGEAGADVL